MGGQRSRRVESEYDGNLAMQSEGKKMKAFLSGILVIVSAVALLVPIAEHRAFAQAPTGPQSGQPQQGAAPPPPPPAPAQEKKPADSGVTIAVEVPVVSLEVVATTQHGDILTARSGPPTLAAGPRSTTACAAGSDAL